MTILLIEAIGQIVRRIDRRCALEIGYAVSALVDDFSAVDEYECGAGDTGLRQLRFDDRVDGRGNDGLEAGLRRGRYGMGRTESKRQERELRAEGSHAMTVCSPHATLKDSVTNADEYGTNGKGEIPTGTFTFNGGSDSH